VPEAPEGTAAKAKLMGSKIKVQRSKKCSRFHVPCEESCVADALSAVPEAPEGTAAKAKLMGSKIKVQ